MWVMANHMGLYTLYKHSQIPWNEGRPLDRLDAILENGQRIDI